MTSKKSAARDVGGAASSINLKSRPYSLSTTAEFNVLALHGIPPRGPTRATAWMCNAGLMTEILLIAMNAREDAPTVERLTRLIEKLLAGAVHSVSVGDGGLILFRASRNRLVLLQPLDGPHS